MSDNAIKDVAQGAVSTTAAKLLASTGATPFGWVSLGASLLSGADMNKSGAVAQTESGLAWFDGVNTGGIKKPVVALDSPASVLMVAGIVIGAVYLVKKMRGK